MGFELRGAEWVAEVTDDQLAEAFGDGTLARGRDYAHRSLVRTVTASDQGRALVGEVVGTQASPYLTVVTRTMPRRAPVPWTSRCTCPVQVDCKHGAAVLLHARQRLRDLAAQAGRSVTPHWEQVLRRVRDEPEREPEVGVEVGLVVHETASPGSLWSDSGAVRLELRPSRRGRTGWHRRTSWGEVSGQFDVRPRVAVRADHREVCDDLVRLHRRRRHHYYGLGEQTVYLDDLGHGAWTVLRRAVEVGMPLFSDPGVEGAVVLDDGEAAVQVDLARDGDEGLTVGARVLPEARQGEPVRQQLLGSPPHGLARWGPDGVLHLLALDRECDAAVGDLLTNGPLDIPGGEADRFLRDYLPRLRRRAQVVSTDGSVELPEPVPPRLLVRVGPAGRRTIRVRFGFCYGDGADRLEVPVGPSSAAGQRDLAAEEQLVAGVPTLDSIPGSRALVPAGSHVVLADSTVLRGMAAVGFVEQTVPELRQRSDVVVELAPDLPAFVEAEEPPQVEIRVGDAPDNDWFDLHVTVRVEDEEVPFQDLFEALADNEDGILLDSGLWFELDHPELDDLRQLIGEARELVDPESDQLRLSRYHLSLWEELRALGLVLEQSETWQRTVEALDDLDTVVAPPVPATVQATLRPYQQDGYAWLATLWRCRLGGILADDMGLGKTLQALAMIARAHEEQDLDAPVLVVAPTSVVGAWTSQAEQFVPHLRVVPVEQTTRKRGAPLSDVVDGASVVVTSYAVARLDAEAFGSIRWSALVLDEAQTVKNFRSKTHRALLALDRGLTLAITGTPIENNLMDLWSLLALTAPGLYPDPQRFMDHYRRPIEVGGRGDLLDRLRTRIRPLMLRRTKEEVATDLPPKQVQVLDVVLGHRHRRIYQTHLQRERQRVLGLLADPDGNRVAILASLTRLRQLALHPALVDPEYAEVESAKVETLVDHLRELAQEGHRALVFSQFTRFLGLVRDRLDAEGIASAYLDGSTRDRRRVVREFRTGDAPAFLISLKAGGVGLTLTEADYVFVLDPWWNPAVENQAIDRAHRIGQDKPVFVYRMVSADTIEERVVALQERKRDLFEKVVEGGELAGAITADDIRGLLGAD